MRLFRFNKRVAVACFALFAATFCLERSAFAQKTNQGGKATKVEADLKKDYPLKESDGNWFVMAKKFSGDSAAYQAKRLTYELRAAYKLPAFVFKYDPDRAEMDALAAQFGKSKKFHYQTSRAVEYAVLVGGFPTGEDLELQKTLDKIRKMNPKSLKDDPQSQSAIERFKISAKTDPQYAGYGPLGGAIPVPNPLLPPEFFNHKGVVDPFIAKLNSDSKFSLLNNKKTYTVRIATFSGDSSMKKSSEAFGDLETRLQYAGLRAAALCEALRNEGVEAWEFHDRDCSFVTIGSFDQYGTLQPDGHTELNPQVANIMKKYGGSLVDGEDGRSKYKAYTIVVEIPDPNSSSISPKKKKLTLACDLRPVIIVVPQRSGEESVKKIALATEQMDRAKRQMVENVAEQSLEAAESNLESAQKFANNNGRALTEEEYLAWAAKTAPKKAANSQAPQKASTSGAYAERGQNSAQAASTQRYQKTTTQNQTASPNVSRELAPAAKSNGATQRPYGSNSTKTARKPSAPTY
ncbi:MAG: hypothetical protein IJM30_03705 [Thermoguttaceae bacterium]|nr:hypothetical protein [Thermoguttaceae bacterium]